MSFLKSFFMAALLLSSSAVQAKIIEFNAVFYVDSASGIFDGADTEVAAKFFVDDSYGENTDGLMNITGFKLMLNGENLGSNSSYWTTTYQAKFWNNSSKSTTAPFTYDDPLFNDVDYHTSNAESSPSYFKAYVEGSDSAVWHTRIRDENNTLIGMAQGSFAITGRVSAVPEPSSLGLFLGGLAMLGFIAHRRKNV